MISLILSLIAIAGATRALQALRLARSDLRVTQAQYALEGMQQEIALRLLQDDRMVRFHWSGSMASGTADVLAEPEVSKLGLEAAADIDEALLRRLDVSDTAALRTRLAALTEARDLERQIVMSDAAPLWRACARSIISRYGQASTFEPVTEREPIGDVAISRASQVWRVRVTLSDGWRDDRLLRFTGIQQRPAATIQRRFSKVEGDDPCDIVFAAA
jgi:hypothetical protein